MIKSNFRPCGEQGAKGDDGITPHIGKNGNWYIGNVDTGIHAQGPRGMRGFQGEKGEQGIQGEQGEKGDKGSNVSGIKTNLEFTKDQLASLCTINTLNDYDVSVGDLVVGDILFTEVKNTTTDEKVILFLKISHIYSPIKFRGLTIGCCIAQENRLDYPFMVCETEFPPHTTEEIEAFSVLGHKESFDLTQINHLDPIELHQQLGLLIPNSDTGSNSLYFGFVTGITETNVTCDGVGCIHGGIINKSSVFVVPSNGTFKDLKVKLSKRKNTVMANLEVHLTTAPNIGEEWFAVPEDFRPIQGTSFYTILGGAVVRCAVMPDGKLQMVEKISGEIKLNLDYTVTFNYVVD